MSRPHGTHDELEPARLLDQQATPAALREALHALRQQAPSAASAQRIREGIARPPASSPIAARWIVSFVVLGLAGVALWPRASEAPSATRVGPPAPDAVSPALAVAPSAQPQAAAVVAPAAPASSPARARVAATPAKLDPATEPAPDAPMPKPRAAEPARAEKRAMPVPVLEPAAPAEAELAASEDVAPATRAIEPPRALPGAPEDAERIFADPQDEAGLLYRAKRLSSTDPQAALRLIVLHEASFPKGAFAQERDMLELQIHERLGHAATVKRLSAAFQERYPGSVYRVSP